ncbi:MAG: CRISPR-associated DxTHG motif protein [Leptolinea sp.]|jgi:CRISPR-associated DxTHG motif protein|nr:CRISPR-associated DxTHG motif protein [Leptolinea sp.]
MILFTFLGAGSYNETTYTLGEERQVTRYSPAAAAGFLAAKSVTAFLTSEAEAAHRGGLEKALPAGCALRCVRIPGGRDEGEFWEIFHILSQEASAAVEEQAWDVTHGFRSLPLLTMLALTFLRSGLGIRPTRVLYSLYEKDAETCPMIDLAPMLALMDWASAADTFSRSGDSRPLASLINGIRSEYIRGESRTNEQIQVARPVYGLATSLEELSSALALIRPSLVDSSVNWLQDKLPVAEDALKFSPRTRPLSLLLPRIGQCYQPLVPADDSVSAHLECRRNLIGWYIERGFYPLAATLEREWVITWLMSRKGKRALASVIEERESMTKVLNRESDEFVKSKTEPVELADIPDYSKLFNIWKKLVEIRNDLDHAGMRPQPKSPAAIIAAVEEAFTILKNLPLEVE